MTVIELAKLVVETRKAQRTYFAHRTPDDLRRSKELEARLDRAAREVLTGDSGPGLAFGEE